MKGRLTEDDFVVDDGVSGYMETGVDDFEEASRPEDSDDECPKAKCA